MPHELVPSERIEKLILLIRGKKVMLDSDLAPVYGVPTKRLKEQVRRNLKRFPPDFMFELSTEEFKSLRSHFATSKSARGGARYKPFAFTEQGVA
ncbi:MAG: ORF6N domain-containing protein, partial [Bacteroidota bacterium]